MTIRQLWVRIKAIRSDPDSPLVREVRADEARAEAEAEKRAIDEALAPFMKQGG